MLRSPLPRLLPRLRTRTAAFAAVTAAALAAPAAPGGAEAGEWSLGGYTALEPRVFFESPQFSDQLEVFQPSVVVTPDVEWESSDRRTQASFKPYFRFDGRDDERTHVDLREAFVRHIKGDWEILAGINTVFWGVTESRHLVNVVNVVDAVEDTDEEDFLGEPMINIALQTDAGRFEVFFLPGARTQETAGEDGRLRFSLPTDDDDPEFQSSLGEGAIDGLFRYSHFIGDWDVGAYYFYGAAREPTLIEGDGVLIPFYDQIHQVGADLQYTSDAWLWKFEGIVREGQGSFFGAIVGGFEYTVFQVAETDADWGLLAEYLYDGRDSFGAPPTLFDNDLFLGTRLTLNDVQDTDFLAGAVIDLEDGTTSVRIEADRRLGDKWQIEAEAQILFNVDPGNIAAAFEEDSFLQLRLQRFF